MASPAAAFSSARADELLDHLAAQIRRARKRPGATAVHDLRVAIRRFGQALKVLEPELDRAGVKAIRNDLKPMMRLTGEIRNCDIAAKLIARMKERVPAAIGRIRRAKERSLLALLQERIDRGAASHWREQLQSLSDLSATQLRKLMRESVTQAREAFERRAGDIDKSTKALHKLRIAAKKLRYTLELAGGPTDAIKELQTKLGEINDYRATRALLKQVPGAAHTRARLAKEQRKEARRFRREFKETSVLP